MAQDSPTTPQHCPGFQSFKHLSSFECRCPECGAVNEIFSDEFNRPHSCSTCGHPIDFTQCSLEGTGGQNSPR
ncbi:MAG: hypothetical protein K9K39_01315 [Desulfohalobiaceae bacterium]|nr:hypothetical protein [Desulfohalobiaceae bacterium]